MTGRDKPIQYWSTPMLKGRLIELLSDLGVGPHGKRHGLTELAGWVIHKLPEELRDDPRAIEATAIATLWWDHERSSK